MGLGWDLVADVEALRFTSGLHSTRDASDPLRDRSCALDNTVMTSTAQEGRGQAFWQGSGNRKSAPVSQYGAIIGQDW